MWIGQSQPEGSLISSLLAQPFFRVAADVLAPACPTLCLPFGVSHYTAFCGSLQREFR